MPNGRHPQARRVPNKLLGKSNVLAVSCQGINEVPGANPEGFLAADADTGELKGLHYLKTHWIATWNEPW